jgi:hypothetical protein
MEPVRQAAFVSVIRATGFAGLAVFMTVVGLSFDLVLAGRTGGVLCLITAVVLMMRARGAVRVDHRRTEAWLLLDEGQRPPAEYAQRVTATALAEAYTVCASHAALAAASLFAVAALAALAG